MSLVLLALMTGGVVWLLMNTDWQAGRRDKAMRPIPVRKDEQRRDRHTGR